ncbi:unnamed protein product [Dracunculus medinensis]|uniref:Galectin n=1 Tax=Dracunculus medinensis TaxID=318479 RepID=A0A0N4UQV1_DRAME|nr:unnamed protein product [Dracunculus medinensis]
MSYPLKSIAYFSQKSVDVGARQKDAESLEPIRKPHLPFELSIKNGLTVNSWLIMTATPFTNAHAFYINFLYGSEYFFHFRVDFPRGKQQGAVVRNTTMNNLWQKEEREISEFPFIAGITFDMNFRFESHKVMVFVNGDYFTKFEYRGNVSLDDVNRMTIMGDLMVQKLHLKISKEDQTKVVV